MAYLFPIQSVYYNTIYAVQDLTGVLTSNCFVAFCRIVDHIMPEMVEKHHAAQAPIVNYADQYGEDTKDFFRRERVRFCKWGHDTVYIFGTITSKELRRINLCLQDSDGHGRVARAAYDEARRRFREGFMKYIEEHPEYSDADSDKKIEILEAMPVEMFLD